MTKRTTCYAVRIPQGRLALHARDTRACKIRAYSHAPTGVPHGRYQVATSKRSKGDSNPWEERRQLPLNRNVRRSLGEIEGTLVAPSNASKYLPRRPNANDMFMSPCRMYCRLYIDGCLYMCPKSHSRMVCNSSMCLLSVGA